MTVNNDDIDAFAKDVRDYDFQLSSGYLEVNTFAGMLLSCMAADGIKHPPSFNDILDLLKSIVEKKVDKRHPSLGEIDVGSDRRHDTVYPMGKCSVLHLASLSFVRELWIYNIGMETSGHAEKRDDQYHYMSWIRPQWVFTSTYISRFHQQCIEIERDSDEKNASERGYSNFECLFLMNKFSIGYDEAAERLKSRNANFKSAIARIDEGIKAGFPLDSIVVSESLISGCLHHFLIATGDTKPPEVFSQLVARFREKGEHAKNFPSKIVEEIDAWRKQRNTAAHRFVARDLVELDKGQEVFLEEARETAVTGRDVCAKFLDWFHRESYYFLETDFNVSGPTLN